MGERVQPGDWVALAAAIVALAAMSVTIWQTVDAKKSARKNLKEAREQTAAAKASAEAAQRSVGAAEAQAEEARKANELAKQALDRDHYVRDEPQFSVKETRRKKGIARGIAVTLEEGAGVNVTLLEVHARPSDVAVEIADGGAGPERLVKGAFATFAIRLGPVVEKTQIELLLNCEEINGTRCWPKWETVTIFPPARVLSF